MSPIRINGNTGYTEIAAPTSAGSNTLVLPTSNGTAHQILKNGATAGSLAFGLTFPSGNGSNGQTLIGDGAGAVNFNWDAGSLFYRLDSNLAGANVTTAQSVFGVGVTLAGSTVYMMEALYILAKSVGAVSHTLGFGFGGTSTLNNIAYEAIGGILASSTPSGQLTISSVTNGLGSMANSAANTVTQTGIGAAAVSFSYILRGTVSINAGGTFIPQYTLSAAPGGAYSTVAGSYIKFTPIGAAGSASSQGTWS